MIVKLYSVFDQKVNAYMPLFGARSDGEAMRQFSDAINAKDGQMSRYPQDFVLLYIGAFDDDTGMLIQQPTDVRSVLKGLEVEKIGGADPFDRR